MLADYLILDLLPDAGDNEIRQRYLELVKRHPPESDPERFQEITAAFETLKTRRQRIADKLFGAFNMRSFEDEISRLDRACRTKRRPATLAEIIAANETCQRSALKR